MAHIVSFDEDESGSGKFSRVNSLNDSRGSFSFDINSDSVRKSSQLNISKEDNGKSAGAITDTSFQSFENLDSVLDRSMEDSASSRVGLAVPRVSRDPSISSLRSESRHSQGSISSIDFELRYFFEM